MNFPHIVPIGVLLFEGQGITERRIRFRYWYFQSQRSMRGAIFPDWGCADSQPRVRMNAEPTTDSGCLTGMTCGRRVFLLVSPRPRGNRGNAYDEESQSDLSAQGELAGYRARDLAHDSGGRGHEA